MTESRYESLGNVYLYYCISGNVTEYEAELFQANDDYDSWWHSKPLYKHTIATAFRVDGEHDKTFLVYPKEGIVLDNLVWLRKSNITKATKLFIKEEYRKINELRRYIKNHKAVIEKLKNSLGEG